MKRAKQGWFAEDDQDKPIRAPDFLCKVNAIPPSVIRETETHFESSANPQEIMRAVGNTRKVVLSALYAQVLRRIGTPSSRILELVKMTETKSVRRLDVITRISAIREVIRLLSCRGFVDFRAGE